MTLDWRHAYRDREVLVLGASGFIGRWVARSLSQAGAKLRLVTRDAKRGQGLTSSYDIAGEWIEVDLADPCAASALIERTRPHVVFNLSGYGVARSERDEARANLLNRDLVGALAEALAQSTDGSWPGVRLIHTGSAFEYGRAGGDLNESTPAKPCTLYGETKLAGTRRLTEVCRAADLKGATVRVFTVFGPGERTGRLLPSLMQIAESGAELEMTAGIQERDFTYVEDVAEGLLRVACSQAAPGAVINLATGRLTSVRRFVELAAGVLQISESQLRFAQLATGLEEMEHDPVNTALLQSLTHWRPATSIEQGVGRTSAFRSETNS